MSRNEFSHEIDAYNTSTIPRSKYLHLLPYDAEISLSLSICAALYQDKVCDLYNPQNAKEWVTAYESFLRDNFNISEQNDESGVTGHAQKFLPKSVDEIAASITEILENFRWWEKNEALKQFSSDDGFEEESSIEHIGSIYDQLDKEFGAKLGEHSFDLATCGISLNDLRFIFENCLTHKFVVNVLGMYGNKIYPIQLGLGARRYKVKKNADQFTFINIVKFTLKKDTLPSDSEKKIDDYLWDRLIDENVINKKESADEIRQALEDSETAEQKKDREFLKATFNIQKRYKDEFKKEHKEWVNDLKRAENSLTDVFYFAIRNLDAFLRQSYSSEPSENADDGSRNSVTWSNARFCQKCIRPVYSAEKLIEHEKLCLSRSDYYREIMPFESEKHGNSRKWVSYRSKMKAPIKIFADFESVLKPGTSACPVCVKSGVGRPRCLCTDGLETGIDQEKAKGTIAYHLPATLVMVAVNANNEIIKERVLHLNDSADMVKRGSELFVKTLLEDEPFYKSILKQDFTPHPSKTDFDTFFSGRKCVICDQSFK